MAENTKIVVMASGSGTVLQSLLDAELPITAVVTDRECRAELIAKTHGIHVIRVGRDTFEARFDRETYTKELLAVLIKLAPDLVAMAGFGTVLHRGFEDSFRNRILNTHPSLLPEFKGWHAVRDALAAGVTVTGCTIHVATSELDAGPILFRQEIAIAAGESEESLHEKIKEVERWAYSRVIRKFIDSGFRVWDTPLNCEDLKNDWRIEENR